MRKPFLLLTLLVALSSTPALGQSHVRPTGINLEGYEYPFPVEVFEFTSQGIQLEMAYMVVKPENPNGNSVILFHGKNFNGAYWERTANDLAAKGYRVVIPDQVGFGKSSKPDTYHFSFHQLARNTMALLDELGIDKVFVVGHSMGGMLAARFAIMYPDRVPKLVLLNPIGLEDWQQKGVPYRGIDAWYKRELDKTAEGIRKYQLVSYYDGQWKEEYDPWVDLLAAPLSSPDYPRLAKVQALTYDMIYTQPVIHDFPNIRADTLLIIGQRDRTALGKDLVSEEVKKTLGLYDRLDQEATELIPNSKLVELEGIGHLPHIEAYDRYIGPLIEFLEN